MKASDFIIEYLRRLGVKNITGYSGGAIAHIIDSIYLNNRMNFIHFNHEQGAAFASSALAKYSNQLQVVIATSGPGATNLITGIAEAYFDSVPLLVITGQVNTYDFNHNEGVRQTGFQETDIVSIVKPITKYANQITDVNSLKSCLDQACRTALTGRKGPVLLDIPMDIQRSELDVKESDEPPKIEDDYSNKIEDLDQVINLIKESQRPVVLAGGGASLSQAQEELKNFSEKFNIPVLVSLMGKDSFDHEHKNFAGYIGAYGNRYGNILLARSDLLIVLGSRLDSRQIGNVIDGFKNKTIIWVDIEAYEIKHAKLKATKAIVSNLRSFLKQLLSHAKKQDFDSREKYFQIIDKLKSRFKPMTEINRAGEKSWHYEVFEEISKNLKDDDVICVDVGQIQMLAAQLINIRKNMRFINSGGLAPMGYAIPAAANISLSEKKRCIAIVGDGGYQINIQELNLIAKNKIPVIIVLLNNQSLGMIKQFQKLYFNERYSGTDASSGYYCCDFQAVTKAYGIESIIITEKDLDYKKILESKLKEPGPLLIEIKTTYDTYVYPKLRFDKSIEEIEPTLNADEKEFVNQLFMH